MGFFVLDLEDKETIESNLKTAIANIELFIEGGCKSDYDYLIKSFARNYIERAIEKINKNSEK